MYSRANANADTHAYSYPNAYSHAYSDGYRHSCTDPNSHVHTYLQSNTEFYPAVHTAAERNDCVVSGRRQRQ